MAVAATSRSCAPTSVPAKASPAQSRACARCQQIEGERGKRGQYPLDERVPACAVLRRCPVHAVQQFRRRNGSDPHLFGGPELRGADDRRVLETAAAEARVVITEDVSTFSVAIALVPHHLGSCTATTLASRAPGRA